MATAGPGRSPMRERFREQVRDDVKAVALEQLATGGPAALSVNAIGRELGVSGPALYRYFANRDELLTELVVDAYHDLAVALAEASRRSRPARRLRDLATAYRTWANAQPHRYRLLFAAPLPGYDAHSARLVAAAQEAMNILLGVLSDVMPDPLNPRPGPLDKQRGPWARAPGPTGPKPAPGLRA